MSRKKASRKSATTVFIACEGRSTEPAYFQRIKEQVEESGDFALTIYPDDTEPNPKTDALGLIEEAKRRSGEFDEVWVVFDKDGYTKHADAFTEAHTHEVKIGFSSIAFEHWVLLHFERSKQPFVKSQDIIQDKLRGGPGFFPTYTKKAHVDIYDGMRHHTHLAIENAAWLRHQQKPELSTKKIYEVNPYTDLDILVARLLGMNTILWIGLGEKMTVEQLSLSTTQEASTLNIHIENKRPESFVTQSISYKTRNSAGESEYRPLESKLISPGGTETISLPINSDVNDLMIRVAGSYLMLAVPQQVQP
ncbi:MAG: RloB domain-containing protein [Bacteroidetes bacterium]|nr:MAG: RloB domain-containing protein [Bacteroidota bacterium]